MYNCYNHHRCTLPESARKTGLDRKVKKMTKTAYTDKKMQKKSLIKVDQANEIIEDYDSQGYKLTLRQLYYQFVSKDLIPNNMKEYKKLGAIINDARLTGLIDWNAIEDRGRSMSGWYGSSDPEDAIRDASYSYKENKNEHQDTIVEVWIEKEALTGVIRTACFKWQLPFFACKGYVSQSAMHEAAMRHVRWQEQGKNVIVLHMGDHDPSGIDMTRDNQDRLNMFGSEAKVLRIGLNMDQINKFNPPPNPTKFTDSRSTGYLEEFGNSSWELDALTPDQLNELIEDEIDTIYDKELWQESKDNEKNNQDRIRQIARNYDEICGFLDGEE